MPLHIVKMRCTMNRIHVVNSWKQGELAAYLFGFDVNKSHLEAEHKSFLHQTLADVFQQWGNRKANPNDVCHMWLVGTASRSGTWRHNSPLANARADSVRKFLEGEL